MNPFSYLEGANLDGAARAVGGAPGAVFLAGGTTLVDLMKLDVLKPALLVDVNRLPLGKIESKEDGLYIGANVRNSQLAWHPEIRRRYGALSEALLSGASTQLRNMASTAGNLMQRTRCPYFRDVHAACNRREPGSGCDAIDGINRGHAVLGTSEHCIAVHPSDLCVALAIFDARVRTRRANGESRDLLLNDLHCLPGDTPERETLLEHGELITHVVLPPLQFSHGSHYLKVKDRASYEFALASAAVALSMDGDQIVDARIALGGVAVKPWRAWDAERILSGKKLSAALLRAAADAALATARPWRQNGFKIELAKRTIVRALKQLLERA